MPTRPQDWQARALAVDPTRSLIVQAPAGSGKTELLIQRILTLLSRVERPEDILAITFTRKAASEMRQRLLDALQAAAAGESVASAHQQATRELALQVLDQDRRQGWTLLQNPARLQILTIDSLCAALVRRMPWLSRFGATPEISEDATPLYRQAANRIVELIRTRQRGADEVAVLLRHLDNRMDVLRDLLADMLGKRDQWLRHLLGQRDAAARQILEQGLRSYIAAQLESVLALLPEHFSAELAAILPFAAGNLQQQEGLQLPWFLRSSQLPPATPDQLPHWQGLAELLLTKSGTPRKKANKNQGFPPGSSGPDAALKQRFEALLEQLVALPALVLQLGRLQSLPRPSYSEVEWNLIAALVQLLPLAVVELEAVFREQGSSDFIAVAGAARAALGDGESPEELLLQIDSQLQHILVDEFQDTAYGQYVLLQQLTAGWQPGDGRTLFVVGDPMQSIYRFREAEVGLFLRARRSGLGALRLEPLQLTANFRSDRGLVDWFNQNLARLFPPLEDEARGAVCFAAASAARPAAAAQPVTVRSLPQRDDAAEAQLVVEAVQQARQNDPQQTVAILVRSRAHAGQIVAALQQAGLRCQAREIVQLRERSIIQDLLALTRALLHRGDRVAWLSLLRAPWCGLPLDGLLEVVGEDGKTPVIDQLLQPAPQENLFSPLTTAHQLRLQRVTRVLQAGLARRGRSSLRRLVESTWLALGGPACCEAAELADAQQFFRLLERLDSGGDLARLADLDTALDGLYAAPDPLADERLQLMTIHKAKGLEFDTVILPGLGRPIRSREKALLRWLEHPDHELLLAPIPAADGSGEGATYAAIGQLLKDKEDLEVIRLLYVAATRARESLVLLGHLQPRADGEFQPQGGSLLAAGWAALAEPFLASLDLTPVAEPPAAPPASRRLRHLPNDYRLPTWPETPEYQLQASRFASRLAEAAENAGISARSGAARIIGETVHAFLERHTSGASELDAGLRAALERQLLGRGLPQKQLESSLGKTLKCIENAIRGERGQWLFQPHREQANELALAGIIAGELVQAKIDRTFVDGDNVRWIVDYKTSSPGHRQELESFYRQQREQYAPQLESYRELMQHLDPGRAIRMALYFPAFDGWCELPSDD